MILHEIHHMNEANQSQIHHSGSILLEALRDFPSACKDLPSARIKTERFLTTERIAF
jgi:hypothetical protein